MSSLADIRKDYKLKTLSEKDVDRDAFKQFDIWWKEASESSIDEINAMTLATASNDGIPSARIVLLKGYTDKGFVFFSNYESFKGRQLQENPRACLVLFWKELERQVRIMGLVEKLPESESNEYFNSRPEKSRIAAWASPQSRQIPGRGWLESNDEKMANTFRNKKIVRPDYWGGYIVKPISIEFWQGRPNRLHDRIEYTLQENNSWDIVRLAP